MENLLKAISKYEILNNLIPGVVFCVLARSLTSFDWIQAELLVGLIFYYFVGMVISRFGSIVIEPMLKWLKVIEFVPYQQFVTAAKVDDKIDVLSEQNNVYRTLVSMLLLLGLLAVLDWSSIANSIPTYVASAALLVCLLLLFVIAYSKQTKYVTARVKNAENSKSKES